MAHLHEGFRSSKYILSVSLSPTRGRPSHLTSLLLLAGSSPNSVASLTLSGGLNVLTARIFRSRTLIALLDFTKCAFSKKVGHDSRWADYLWSGIPSAPLWAARASSQVQCFAGRPCLLLWAASLRFLAECLQVLDVLRLCQCMVDKFDLNRKSSRMDSDHFEDVRFTSTSYLVLNVVGNCGPVP